MFEYPPESAAMVPTTVGQCCLTFSELAVANANEFALKHQTVVPNNQQTRDLVLFIKCGSQEAKITFSDMEQNIMPKVIFWTTLDMWVEMRIEEHVFKLERDEAAMLARLKETNLHATGVESFLMSK